MSTIKSTAQNALAPVQLRVRPITVALAGLLTVALIAIAIVLAANAGSSDEQSGFSKSVRVTPSAPTPPSPAERHQEPGLNGPGMRP